MFVWFFSPLLSSVSSTFPSTRFHFAEHASSSFLPFCYRSVLHFPIHTLASSSTPPLLQSMLAPENRRWHHNACAHPSADRSGSHLEASGKKRIFFFFFFWTPGLVWGEAEEAPAAVSEGWGGWLGLKVGKVVKLLSARVAFSFLFKIFRGDRSRRLACDADHMEGAGWMLSGCVSTKETVITLLSSPLPVSPVPSTCNSTDCSSEE